jgi:uncharacterized protein (TIGR02646 family)
MILIKKNEEPKEWKKHRSTPGVDYQANSELLNSLCEEQGYICAYCMSRIHTKDSVSVGKEGRWNNHRIEHILCRKLHDDLKLNYNNMVVCCSGYTGSEEHCDRKKGDRDISFSPLKESDIKMIQYSPNGRIYSSNEAINGDINSILNLNAEMLVQNRKAVLQEVFKQLQNSAPKGTGAKGSFIRKLLKKYSEKHREDDKLKYYPYCGIVTYFLQKKL